MSREEAIDIIKCLAWHTRPNEEDIEQAIKDLEQEPNWIPVSERLPDKNGRYLVTVKQGYITFGAWVGVAENWAQVTAWMPLPHPYEPQERSDDENDFEKRIVITTESMDLGYDEIMDIGYGEIPTIIEADTESKDKEMTREEIIDGLKFTIDMFLFDPSTGEKYTEPRNDMDKTTIDACKGAIELLEQEPCEDAVSRGVFEQVMWERDVAIEQLEELGYSLGEKPKIGHWIEGKYRDDDIRYNDSSYKCDKCGRIVDFKENFCPDCGTRMVKPQESEDKG